MKSATRNRLDPMHQVAPFDLLKVANALIRYDQVEAYWENVPIPKPPIGKVRFEVLRQAATFAIPLLGLYYLHVAYGLKGVLFGLPVAWLAGCILDLQLSNAIEKQRRLDCELDRCRYRAVNQLAEEMGMRREEVTLTVIRKMDADYHIVKRLIDEKARQEEKEKAARRSNARARRTSEDSDENFACSTRATGKSNRYYEDEPVNYFPIINPASGMPMIHGTSIDVAGNPYGMG